MAILDGASFFRNTVIPSIPGVNGVKRVPFTFTSTLRLLQSGKIDIVSVNSARQSAEFDRKAEISSIEASTRGVGAAHQLGLSNYIDFGRNFKQETSGMEMPIISMAVNPNTIAWRQAKRITRRDTMEGAVFFHFQNSADQNNDIIEITFSGQTGNIGTQGEFLDVMRTGANLKLRIWHELYNLSREPMLISGQTLGKNLPTKIKNEFFISYRTPLFPVQITLTGHFSNVLDFTESANDPFNRNYSFRFVVTSVSPSLDQMSQLMNSALSVTGQGQMTNIVQDNSNIG